MKNFKYISFPLILFMIHFGTTFPALAQQDSSTPVRVSELDLDGVIGNGKSNFKGLIHLYCLNPSQFSDAKMKEIAVPVLEGYLGEMEEDLFGDNEKKSDLEILVQILLERKVISSSKDFNAVYSVLFQKQGPECFSSEPTQEIAPVKDLIYVALLNSLKLVAKESQKESKLWGTVCNKINFQKQYQALVKEDPEFGQWVPSFQQEMEEWIDRAHKMSENLNVKPKSDTLSFTAGTALSGVSLIPIAGRYISQSVRTARAVKEKRDYDQEVTDSRPVDSLGLSGNVVIAKMIALNLWSDFRHQTVRNKEEIFGMVKDILIPLSKKNFLKKEDERLASGKDPYQVAETITQSVLPGMKRTFIDICAKAYASDDSDDSGNEDDDETASDKLKEKFKMKRKSFSCGFF